MGVQCFLWMIVGTMMAVPLVSPFCTAATASSPFSSSSTSSSSSSSSPSTSQPPRQAHPRTASSSFSSSSSSSSAAAAAAGASHARAKARVGPSSSTTSSSSSPFPASEGGGNPRPPRSMALSATATSTTTSTSTTSPTSHPLPPPPNSANRSSTTTTATTTTTTTGENEDANMASWYGQLLFSYVHPLLDKASSSPSGSSSSSKTLTETDAFPLKSHHRMGSSVSHLDRWYRRCRLRALRRHVQRSNTDRRGGIRPRPKKRRRRRGRGGNTDDDDGTTTTTTTSIVGSSGGGGISESAVLARALWNSQRRTLLTTGILRLINTLVQAFPSLLVARFLKTLETTTTTTTAAGGTTTTTTMPSSSSPFQAAWLLLLVLSVKMVTENQYFHRVVQCATQVRGSLTGLLFEKSLRLPTAATATATTGSGATTTTTRNSQSVEDHEQNKRKGGRTGNHKKKKTKLSSSNEDEGDSDEDEAGAVWNDLGVGGVLNLMQSDASILESASLQIHTIWDGPLQIAVYSTLLFRYLGRSVLYGMAVLMLTIPINSVALRVLHRMAQLEIRSKDARTKRTSESLAHIQLLKLQGWQDEFRRDIDTHRTDELDRHARRGVVRAVNSAVFNAMPSLALVSTLGAYARTGQPVVASTIFTAISLFNQLRFPLFFLPNLIDSLANGRNALDRISSYLSQEEMTPYVRTLPPLVLASPSSSPSLEGTSAEADGHGHGHGDGGTRTGGSIQLINGNFLWSASSSSSSLSPISKSSTEAKANESTTTTAATVGGAGEEEKARTASARAKSGDVGATTTMAAPALCNVNLQVNPGEVVAVVGPVGSGKSALIKGLLGELSPVPRAVVDGTTTTTTAVADPQEQRRRQQQQQQRQQQPRPLQQDVLEQPRVVTHGSIAYASQEAWLPKGTLRDAVIFGRPFHEGRYREALRDAGLDDDMISSSSSSSSSSSASASKAAASRGVLSDDTDVGEGGSSLSGGQRARVALARALYDGSADNSTGVYLLDDPLAALDASVGSTVFERLTRRLRGANAATVLVTNDPSLPRRCDRVVLMGKYGRHYSSSSSSSSSSCSTIIDVGTYDELIARGHDLTSIATNADEEDEEEGDAAPAAAAAVAADQDTSAESHIEKASALDRVTVAAVTTMTTTTTTMAMRKKKDEDSHLEATAEAGAPPPIQKDSLVRLKGGFRNGYTSDCTVHTHHADCDDCLKEAPDYMGDKFIISERTEEDERPVIMTPGAKSGTVLEPDVEADAGEADGTAKERKEPGAAAAAAPVVPEAKKKPVSADDAMSTGAVPFRTYVTYFKAVRKPLLVVAMVLSSLTAYGAQFFQQYTIAKWTETAKTGAMAAALGSRYLRSLVQAAGVASLFLWLRSFLIMRVGINASEFLHNRMLSSVFSAPMSFFDATPSGQLLSRFGKELETVDRALPDGISSVMFCFLQIFLSGASLAGAISPAMLLPIGLIGVLYVRTMSRFRPAARDLKRSESKSRSPIYTHFSEALRGTEVIRSVPNATRTWSLQHQALSDLNLSVFTTVKSLDRWLSVRLETLGNFIVFSAALASIALSRRGMLQSGSAGWGLTQSLAITGLLTWAVRTLTDLETQMMSVMRVQELTDLDSEGGGQKGGRAALPGDNELGREPGTKMPREYQNPGDALKALYSPSGPRERHVVMAPPSDGALLRSGWPWNGDINFRDVSMRYNSAAPLVLKNVTLTVPRGSSLGVVGRTGSGKSSLLLTLFRLVEIEGGGTITIDGIDIRSVSLQTLRESLSIIPQNPVLFAGTLFYNLDATGKASREDAWAALEAASPELAKEFQRAGTGLDTYITEGGKNLSAGQRQLICLARALLRRSKILVLDEATSSVDSRTDAQVQATIRREFVDKGVSVMTVAHRLDTVLGYDKIAVLGSGTLLEYGTPADLLKIPNGELRRLVEADRQNKRKGGAGSGNRSTVLPPPEAKAVAV